MTRYILEVTATQWLLVDLTDKPAAGEIGSPAGHKIVKAYSQSNEDYQRAQLHMQRLEEEAHDLMEIYGELPDRGKALANAQRRHGKNHDFVLVPGHVIVQARMTYALPKEQGRHYGKREFGVYVDGVWAGTIRQDSAGHCHANPYCNESSFQRGEEK